MTKNQMKFLTVLYKKDLTLQQISNNSGLIYEQFLPILSDKEFISKYIIIYDRINPIDSLYGLSTAGIEAVEANIDSLSDKLFSKRTMIVSLIISFISLGISIYSIYLQYH